MGHGTWDMGQTVRSFVCSHQLQQNKLKKTETRKLSVESGFCEFRAFCVSI